MLRDFSIFVAGLALCFAIFFMSPSSFSPPRVSSLSAPPENAAELKASAELNETTHEPIIRLPSDGDGGHCATIGSGLGRLPRNARKSHGCTQWLKSMGQRFFRIHHLFSQNFSIDRKIVRLFGPSLAALLCDGTTSKRKSAIVVDIGVNDADDVPYWFEKFGYMRPDSIFASDVCQKQRFDVSFRLFEPQATYRETVEKVFHEQIARPSSLAGVSIAAQFDAVAVGSDALHNSTMFFYGKGQQASLGAVGRHAKVGKPVEVRVGSLSKMLAASWKSDLSGIGKNGADHKASVVMDPDAPIAFMKIDCEGADPTIIVDSEALFASHRVHLLDFELHKNERGFPKKFKDAVAMLRRHSYEVYLIGRCHSSQPENRGGAFFLRVDQRTADAWIPTLEAGIALSPQLQAVMGGSANLGRYFGGWPLSVRSRYPCGAGWEWVPNWD